MAAVAGTAGANPDETAPALTVCQTALPAPKPVAVQAQPAAQPKPVPPQAPPVGKAQAHPGCTQLGHELVIEALYGYASFSDLLQAIGPVIERRRSVHGQALRLMPAAARARLPKAA